MRMITERQKEILDFIIGYIDSKKYSPTVREIGEHFKISAKGAYDHIHALERKGYIKGDYKKPRTLTVLKEARDVS